MANIHPTAIIGDQVELADDVIIGPGCMIEGRVTIDPGCRLIAQVHLRGPMTIGSNNRIYPFTCLGYEPQDWKFDPDHDGAGTVIGNGNLIREGVTIHRATGDHPTTVGDRNYLMANSHLGHDAVIGSDCNLANGSLLAGHVLLGDRVTLGGNAVVHQYCRVGRLAMISGVQGITQDLPPFCVVYDCRRVGSLNIIGLRRAGYRDHIKTLSRAFQIIFKEKHANQTVIAMIRSELRHDALCMELIDFIESSKRGICSYGTSPAS